MSQLQTTSLECNIEEGLTRASLLTDKHRKKLLTNNTKIMKQKKSTTSNVSFVGFNSLFKNEVEMNNDDNYADERPYCLTSPISDTYTISSDDYNVSEHEPQHQQQQQDERKEKKPNVMDYFTQIDTATGTGYRCNLCSKILKSVKTSDTNLRKHLGTKENMPEFLYPSQRYHKDMMMAKKQKNLTSSSLPQIPNERKIQLDNAILECIIEDSRSFLDFNTKGMRQFLKIAVPGYEPPNRETLRRRLGLKGKKSTTTGELKKIFFFSV